MEISNSGPGQPPYSMTGMQGACDSLKVLQSYKYGDNAFQGCIKVYA